MRTTSPAPSFISSCAGCWAAAMAANMPRTRPRIKPTNRPKRVSAGRFFMAASRASVGVRILQHHERGPEENPQVERQRPVPEVVEVELDAPPHLVHAVGLAAQAVHLRPAGDARLHLVAHHVAADQAPLPAME